MNIPNEAIEAAAKGAFKRTHPHGNWSLAISDMRDQYLSEAHAALEAAAPYMLAEAWEQGYEAADYDAPHSIKTDNPYRTVP